jgi:hypothetical protein
VNPWICLKHDASGFSGECQACKSPSVYAMPHATAEVARLRPIVDAAKAWAESRRLDVDPMPSEAARRRYAEALVAALANAGEL